MSESREEIKKFIKSLREKHGNLPKFCHNLNAPDNKVYYSGPYFDDNEMVAAIDTLLFGKWASSGEVCARFEKEFSNRINQKHSFFTNSGSSANLLLIASCKEYYNWKDGDEIIVSAVGFPTTVSAIVQNGLKPVFVDIEWDTLNFDLDKIPSKYTDRTKAIFLSPVLGNPPNMDELCAISDSLIGPNNEPYEIKLLLDNCDSLGSKWRDKYLNEYAVASSCSFYPAHEITTLEGGMVSSNVEEIVKLARSYATWGRDCYCVGKANLSSCGTCGKRFSNWLPDFPDTTVDHKYVFNRIGYNLKPLDLQAAIGLEQLNKLEYIYRIRQTNLVDITKLFLKYTDTKTVKKFVETDWVPFGVPIICKSKEQKLKLVQHLEKNGIQTRNYFAGNLLMHSGYKHLDDHKEYPKSNGVLDLVFFVGCAPTISKENINHIEEVLKGYDG